MDFESYRQSINSSYGKLQSRYVLQDAEGFQSPARAQKLLFADRMLMTWQPKSEKADSEQEQEQQPVIEKYKVLDGLLQFAEKHVLLIGQPGSGKTTVLQKLLLDEVQKHENLPILIELRGFKTSVLDIVYAFAEANQLSISLESLQQRLSQGRCLLLIDGLNELPSEAAQSELVQFIEEYRKCSIVATTRDIELGGDFGIQKKLALQPLTTDQIKSFVQAYLPDKTKVKVMLKQLRPRLNNFQETPLLLLMLCAVFSRDEQIPENLGLAFREFARVHDEEFKLGIDRIDYCRQLLSYLAFKMMIGTDRLSPLLAVREDKAISWLSELTQVEDSHTWAKGWLEFLRKYHLIQRRSDRQLEFKHQLWQEYYAAEYLVDYFPHVENEQIKCNFLNLLKWTEPLKIVQSLIDNPAQALRIARLGLETDLLLGAVLSGAVSKNFELQSIEQLVSYPLPIKWRNLGFKFWRLPLSKPKLQLRLLAATASEHASSCIATFLNSPVRDVRLSAVDALGKLGNERAMYFLRELLKDSDRFMRARAASALVKIGNEQAVSLLLEVLVDSDRNVRWNAASALGRLKKEQAVAPLIQALKRSTSHIVRSSAAQSLGIIGNKRAIISLARALEDPNLNVRSSAARSLSKIGGKLAITKLIKVLQDPNEYVGSIAAQALGEIGSERAVDSLIKLLKNPNKNVRRRAIWALGEIDSERSIDSLIEMLKDSDKEVRQNAAQSLAKLGNEQAISLLAERFTSSNKQERRSAAIVLGELGYEQAITPLVEALQSSNKQERRSAAMALGELGSKQAISPLIKALKDTDSFVRRSAAKVLGKFSDDRAISPLVKALGDTEIAVRRSAAKTLGNTATGVAVDMLWYQQLQSWCLYESDDYTQAIETLQSRCQFYNYTLYQQGAKPLLHLPIIRIPSVEPSAIRANFTGNIGAVNIDSVVNGSVVGTQMNHPNSPEVES